MLSRTIHRTLLALALAFERMALCLTSLADGLPTHQLPCRAMYCPCCEEIREGRSC